ncbi:hypothetical protein BN1723_003608 [Verticillium longisporum]|uniref:Uncharacterized protein n=1 Tax=Verticillium longisporum TaxID=100787 RepID=A0A0G4M631_VERLO|nr:hypothetical protein BN1723_003608 [Verticillium longisporum]
MAPNGPRAQTTAKDADKLPAQPPIPEGVVALDHTEPPKGPHPGHVQVACLFTLEQKLQRMLKEHGCEPAREDTYRLQGVQLLDNVREGRKVSRYLVWCEQCKVDEPQPGFTPAITPSFTPSFTPGSPATTGSAPGSNPPVTRSTRGTEGTMRFVFDMDQAKVEKKAVDSYLHEEYDDVEIDRVEAIPEAERQQQQQQHHQQQHRERRHDGGRGGPYSRNNNRDRRKGGPRFY